VSDELAQVSAAIHRVLVRHEAERQDLEARTLNASQPPARYMARRVVKMLAVRKPSLSARRRASDWFVAEILVDLALSTPSMRRLVRRQLAEKRAAFGRVGDLGRVTLPPVTKSDVAAELERMRMVEQQKLSAPSKPMDGRADAQTPPTRGAAPPALDQAGRQLPDRASLDRRSVE